MSDFAIDIVTDFTTDTQRAKAAHIVRVEPGKSAVAVVTEARIYGTPVEALCGEMFVPQQDPAKLPLCSKCKEVYDLERALNEHLNETPNA